MIAEIQKLPNQWLTEKDVAKITSLSVSTLQKQRFHSTGIIYSKVGKSVRYSLQDVEAFMQERRIELLVL